MNDQGYWTFVDEALPDGTHRIRVTSPDGCPAINWIYDPDNPHITLAQMTQSFRNAEEFYGVQT